MCDGALLGDWQAFDLSNQGRSKYWFGPSLRVCPAHPRFWIVRETLAKCTGFKVAFRHGAIISTLK